MLAELFRATRPRTTTVARPAPANSLALGLWTLDDPVLAAAVVTDEDALGLPVVSDFLAILVGLVVQMGLHAWTDGTRSGADPPILRNPAPGTNRTLADFVGEYLRAMALRGNYVAILGDNSWTGWPDVLYPVPAGQWTVETDSAGAVWYTIGGTRYPARDVFHVTRNTEPGELVGRGLLDTHRQLIAASVHAERWAAKYFAGGAVPPAVLEHPDPDLTQANADKLKLKYNLATTNREALVVPAGIKLQALASDAERAQLAETRRTNDQKLALACGIPGALLGLEGPSLTYRNITDVFQQFLSSTVMGYLEPLEQQFSTFTLPRGTEARFDTAAVLRPDLAERVSIAVQAHDGGLITADEGRALLDLPPLNPTANPQLAEPGTGAPTLEVVAS